MTTELNFITIAFLIGLTAVGYAAATAGMKLATGGLTLLAFALVALGLAGAVAAEIILLRGIHLAVIYLAIMAVETLLVLGMAAWFGDTLDARQLAGAGLVLGGMVLVAH